MLGLKNMFTRLTHDSNATIHANFTRGTDEFASLHFGKTTAYSVERKRDLVKNIISATVQGEEQQPLYITADDINVLIEACKVCTANGLIVAYPTNVAHIITPVIAAFNQSTNKDDYIIVGVKPAQTSRLHPALNFDPTKPAQIVEEEQTPRKKWYEFKVRRELSFLLSEEEKHIARASMVQKSKEPVEFKALAEEQRAKLRPVLSFDPTMPAQTRGLHPSLSFDPAVPGPDSVKNQSPKNRVKFEVWKPEAQSTPKRTLGRVLSFLSPTHSPATPMTLVTHTAASPEVRSPGIPMTLETHTAASPDKPPRGLYRVRNYFN